MRIPESAVPYFSDLLHERKQALQADKLAGQILLPAQHSEPIKVPLFSHSIPAGFPSPAADDIKERLSLDQHLITHKEATFFVRAKGNSMVGAGIFDGDLLVVDKAIEPKYGHIVVAVVDGDFTAKILDQRDGKPFLKAANPRYKDIEFKDGQELQVWGVVTSTIKKLV